MSDIQGDGTSSRYRKIELDGYDLPIGGPLSIDEVREAGRAIQAGNAALARLVELLAPALEAVLESADVSPFDRHTLLVPALAGARQAVEHHALSGAADGEFVDRVAAMIQQAVAEYIDGSDGRRWDCGGDGTQWASVRLTRQAF
jgi:hypothetical protein